MKNLRMEPSELQKHIYRMARKEVRKHGYDEYIVWIKLEHPVHYKRMRHIATLVCQYYHIANRKVFSSTRKQPFALVRQIALYVLRKVYDYKYMNIGSAFDLNHATVFYSCKEIEKRMAIYQDFRGEIEILINNVKNSVKNYDKKTSIKPR